MSLVDSTALDLLRSTPRKLLDLCGHHKIALVKPSILLRPESDFHFAPGEINVRMMILRLRQFANAVGKSESVRGNS
jgi:hypothetical protein